MYFMVKSNAEGLKVDLHNHLGIGFQGYWQRIQHPLGGNLLEKAYRSCKRNEINVCAVNSQDSSEVIEKGSVHDRLNYLQNSLDSKLERKGYSVEMDGDNVMVVYKDGENPVYFLNSQTVTSKEGVETLVVGRNDVKNGQSLEETLEGVARREDSIVIAEHPLTESHAGMGEENLRKYASKIDAVEGHNSQLIFRLLGKLPLFRQYARKVNDYSQELAESIGKPWVATSDAHRIKDTGKSYISVEKDLIDLENGGEALIGSLRNAIRDDAFECKKDYVNPIGWFKWVVPFMVGERFLEDSLRINFIYSFLFCIRW
jgi:hypothetical protein